MTGLRAMNPINAEGNMFANLFDKVPAKRAGVPDDIVGTILYLVSKAGVFNPNRKTMGLILGLC
jgi:hypothetical protein